MSFSLSLAQRWRVRLLPRGSERRARYSVLHIRFRSNCPESTQNVLIFYERHLSTISLLTVTDVSVRKL